MRVEEIDIVTLKYFLLQMMDVLKDDMEDGELDSSDGEDLGGYTPLQVGYIKCSMCRIDFCWNNKCSRILKLY